MHNVAQHAILIYRGMLVHVRAAVLCVAAKTELSNVRGLQIFPRSSSVRVVAIDASHLSFANRMMIGQVALCSLRLVALQAGFIGLSARPKRYAAFRSERLHQRGTTTSRRIEGVFFCLCFREPPAVALVPFRAADMVHRGGAAGPVTHLG